MIKFQFFTVHPVYIYPPLTDRVLLAAIIESTIHRTEYFLLNYNKLNEIKDFKNRFGNQEESKVLPQHISSRELLK